MALSKLYNLSIFKLKIGILICVKTDYQNKTKQTSIFLATINIVYKIFLANKKKCIKLIFNLLEYSPQYMKDIVDINMIISNILILLIKKLLFFVSFILKMEKLIVILQKKTFINFVKSRSAKEFHHVFNI